MKYPRRARQRGATMVEALLVIAMQAAILSSALFIASAYTHKQASQQVAQSSAFQAGGQGCNAFLGGAFAGPGDVQNANVPSENDSAPSSAFLGSVDAHTGSSASPNVEFAGQSFDLSSQVSATCNEQPVSGDQALSGMNIIGWAGSEAINAV